MKQDFDLNFHVCRLLMDEPFFASLSRRVDKKPSKEIQTAGVRVNPDTAQFEMLYNPEYFEQLPDAHRQGVLIHEFYHLIFEHVTSRMPSGGNSMKWNFATDLSINCLIGEKKLPETCLMPGKDDFADYPPFLTAEKYLDMLNNDENADEKMKNNGGGQLDEHEDWKEGQQSGASDVAKQRLKEIVKQAAEEAARQNKWGSITAECRKEIMKSLGPSVDWRKVLRYFVGQAQKADKTSTMRRINRRYPYIHAGRKTNRIANIAISIDQSGSVDDAMLASFYAELNKLSELATFTVIPFDHRVFEEKVYVWKRGEKRKRERVLTGGTDFNAPTTYVNERGFDGHIVLTDGYAPKPKASRCRRMWVLPQSEKGREYFNTNETRVYVKIRG